MATIDPVRITEVCISGEWHQVIGGSLHFVAFDLNPNKHVPGIEFVSGVEHGLQETIYAPLSAVDALKRPKS